MNQNPFSIHFAITSNNVHKFDIQFIPDLTKALEEAKTLPKDEKSNDSVVYSLVDSIPDSTLINDIVTNIVSCVFEVVPPEMINEVQNRGGKASESKEKKKGPKTPKKK